MNRVIVFKLVFTTITLALLLFQIVIWKKIAPRFSTSKRFKIYRALYFSVLFISQSILWFAILTPGRGISGAFPEWYLPIHRVLLAINYSHFFWLLPLSSLWLIGMILKRLFRRSPLVDPDREHSDGVSRGDFLRKAAGAASLGLNLLPAATSAAAISGMFLGSREIWVNEKRIQIKNLHDDLKGLRCAQLSDIHVGNLIHEKYLNATLDLVRAAKVDYVFVTGDIIDNNNAFLPVAGNFFARLRSLLPWGHVVGVMGNHDYIDNGDKAAQSFGDAGMNVLRNEIFDVKRGRGVLQVAGLDYPAFVFRGQRSERGEIAQAYFLEVQKKLRADKPVVVLNHHPSDFEFLKKERVDLVLSGHTHGGQIQFSQNRESLLNGARWGYKYYVDHYEENGAQLYVNRGLGHWFPLRVGCPPEITVFTLV